MKRQKYNFPRRQVSRHHIVPQSRGGSNRLENIAKVKGEDHQRYHNLFDNKTPIEIISYLVDYFWDGDSSYVNKYIKDNTSWA